MDTCSNTNTLSGVGSQGGTGSIEYKREKGNRERGKEGGSEGE